MIIINFKLYPEAVGEKALSLAVQLSKIKCSKINFAAHSKVNLKMPFQMPLQFPVSAYQVALAPPMTMLGEIRKFTSLPLFAQAVDAVPLGAFTGHTSPEELKLLKVQGAILNHSEKKIPLSQLKKTIQLCQKNRIITVVCASNLIEINKIARLHPDYLAYEPRELIGRKISVTQARPRIITEAVAAVQKISSKTKVLCGAGVHSSEDLRKALQLGTCGILISHAVTKAKKHAEKLEEIMGLK